MSEISRRDFLRASVVGAGAVVAAEGCGDGGPGAGSSGTPPDPSPTGTRPPSAPPGAGTPPPTDPIVTQPPTQPTTPPAMMPPPTGPMPPSTMGTAGMPLRALGKTGVMVSIVGFGSGSQYLRAGEAEAEQLLHGAVELGINYFDTASNYGNGDSQKRLGKYLVPQYRSKVLLVSKIIDRTAEGAKRLLDETLTNLGTDKIDILHFHEIASSADVDRILGKGGAYEVYQRAKEQGVIRFIGLTGHSSGAILVDALRRIKPDVTMCPQNAARELGFTDMVIPHAQQNGIGMCGMKVTAQDALIRNNVKPEELVRYSLSLPVSSMIIGMRSLAVLESCATIARTLKPLTAPEMMQISGKLAALDLRRCLPYRRHGYRDGACWA
jgi:aryl-alcohol dehydrogenase-like predicted oxidoreductase